MSASIRAGALVAFLFAAHLSFGANTAALAMIFAGSAYLFCGLLLATGHGRDAIEILRANRSIAGLYLGVVAVGLWQLTPWGISGPHPVWVQEGVHPAITLDREATVRELLKLGAYAALFLTAAAMARDRTRSRRFFDLFLAAGIGYGVWAYLTFLANPTLLFVFEREYHRDRLAASFLSANSAATLFGVVAILASARLLALAQKKMRSDETVGWPRQLPHPGVYLPGIALVLSLICLVQTESRAGIAATLSVIVLFVGWIRMRAWRRDAVRSRPGRLVIALSGLALVLAVGFGQLALVRYFSLTADLAVRLNYFRAHWEAFLAAPWLGHGLGTFSTVNDLYANLQNWQDLERINAAHNVVLQCLEEGGIVVASLMAATIAAVLWRIIQAMKAKDGSTFDIEAVLAVSALFLVHGQFDFALQVPSMAMTWAVLLGFGTGTASYPDSTDQSASASKAMAINSRASSS